jgi:hypothetical protein
VNSSPDQPAGEGPSPQPLHPQRLTWAVLLGRWIEFARGAVAFPDDDAGRRMRASVGDIIMLQAVWYALANLDELEPDQRALGIDKAELLIEQHTAAIRQRWQGRAVPAMLGELIDDAHQQLAAAQKGS